MNVYTRGIRNAFRNSIRTFGVVVILGISVGLTLTMLIARNAVSNKIQSVKESVGNTISISPAGIRGGQGGGEPLTMEQLNGIETIDHVVKITSTLSDRLTTDNTNLKSAIEAGSFGNRQAGNSGVGFEGPPQSLDGGGTGQSGASGQDSSGRQFTRTFTPPVMVTGTDDLSSATYGGDTVTFTSGEAFDPATNENVAVIGKALAEKNSLNVGSTFKAYDTDIKVVGIYDGGNTFANANIIMPLVALQKISDQADSVTSATAQVDSIDNIDAATSAIKSKLGDKADVTNNQENTKQIIEPLQNVKSISSFSLVGALVAGAFIILLTMMMIVRERRREIGVMKAIGSSNIKTMTQFVVESMTLTVLGLVVGLAIGILAANPVTKMLVNNSSSSSGSSSEQNISQRGERNGQVRTRIDGNNRGGIVGFGNNSLAGARNVQASVGWDILAYGVGAAVLIAVLGSAVPTYLISKVRPSEVMRAD